MLAVADEKTVRDLGSRWMLTIGRRALVSPHRSEDEGRGNLSGYRRVVDDKMFADR
jgi:hypothetical protein